MNKKEKINEAIDLLSDNDKSPEVLLGIYSSSSQKITFNKMMSLLKENQKILQSSYGNKFRFIIKYYSGSETFRIYIQRKKLFYKYITDIECSTTTNSFCDFSCGNFKDGYKAIQTYIFRNEMKKIQSKEYF